MTCPRLGETTVNKGKRYVNCSLKAPANEGQWCGNIVVEANNSPFATPGNIPCGSKNVSKFVPKLLLPQQMFPRLLAAELSGNNRELKQRQRRRQRERHKFAYLVGKNNSFARPARAFFTFVHFVAVVSKTTT